MLINKTLPYDPANKHSIVEFAKKLTGKTLRFVCTGNVLKHNYSGKGNFGQILEKYYFLYEPNSDALPDFPLAKLELKTSPLKLLSNTYKSKERLVLNIINYLEVVNEDFENSSFWKKNSNLLLVFYLHDFTVDILEFIIKLVDEWIFPENDLAIIKKDWETIHKKIADGKAHELSEGDTFYLGACTKGGKGGNLRSQPNSEIKAKQRAYSLKQGYVNHIIATIGKGSTETYGKLLKSTIEVKKKSLQQIVLEKFEKYYDLDENEIVSRLGMNKDAPSKQFYSILTNAILGVQIDKEIEEFKKADVIVRTIRVKENCLPKEDVSFPAFKFEELVKEDWDLSDFKANLERKFLFVFFQFTGNKLVLRKALFWNMPYKDILEAKKVWTKTKSIVSNGNIVKEVVDNIRYTNFPGKTFNRVAHVRPHGRNAMDTYPLPTRDIVTKAKEFTKQSFWLNSSYIRDEIYLK